MGLTRMRSYCITAVPNLSTLVAQPGADVCVLWVAGTHAHAQLHWCKERAHTSSAHPNGALRVIGGAYARVQSSTCMSRVLTHKTPFAQMEVRARMPSVHASGVWSTSSSAHWSFTHVRACPSLMKPNFKQTTAWGLGTPIVLDSYSPLLVLAAVANTMEIHCMHLFLWHNYWIL